MHTGLAATTCARHVSTSSALPTFASHTARLGIRSLSSLASSSPVFRASTASSPSPGLLHYSRPRLTRRPTAIQSVRHDSWTARLQQKAFQAFSRKGRTPPSESQEEAAKDAILDKLMKGRQPTDLMLRCTILDAAGNVTTISGQFKKSDLCTEHRLNPRDLRKIDSRIPNLVPTILVRKEAILVNILHIRALVKADAVILFDTFGSTDSRLHSVFLYHLEHNLKSGGLSGSPYEFRALESILLSVLSALEAESVFIRNLVGGLLAELEDDIDHDRFKRLLHYSRRLASFQNRAKLVEQALEEVLEQDEDLQAMYLSDKKTGNVREEHEELEVLLESFSKQVEEIVNEAENMENNVQSTQEIVELVLDSNRNALLALDLQVSIGTMGIGVGALVAGLFGMNLTSSLEETDYAFASLSALAVAISGLVAWAGMRRLARIRKVGLSRTSGGSKHSSGSLNMNARSLPVLREKRDTAWQERWP